MLIPVIRCIKNDLSALKVQLTDKPLFHLLFFIGINNDTKYKLILFKINKIK